MQVQQQYSQQQQHLPTAQQHHQSLQQQQHVERQIVQPAGPPFASSATKELDDLMASLSDFKVSVLIFAEILQIIDEYNVLLFVMIA